MKKVFVMLVAAVSLAACKKEGQKTYTCTCVVLNSDGVQRSPQSSYNINADDSGDAEIECNSNEYSAYYGYKVCELTGVH